MRSHLYGKLCMTLGLSLCVSLWNGRHLRLCLHLW